MNPLTSYYLAALVTLTRYKQSLHASIYASCNGVDYRDLMVIWQRRWAIQVIQAFIGTGEEGEE